MMIEKKINLFSPLKNILSLLCIFILFVIAFCAKINIATPEPKYLFILIGLFLYILFIFVNSTYSLVSKEKLTDIYLNGKDVKFVFKKFFKTTKNVVIKNNDITSFFFKTKIHVPMYNEGRCRSVTIDYIFDIKLKNGKNYFFDSKSDVDNGLTDYNFVYEILKYSINIHNFSFEIICNDNRIQKRILDFYRTGKRKVGLDEVIFC